MHHDVVHAVPCTVDTNPPQKTLTVSDFENDKDYKVRTLLAAEMHDPRCIGIPCPYTHKFLLEMP
jgi:hypothetical protein